MEIHAAEMHDARDGLLKRVELAAAAPDGSTIVAIRRARLQELLVARLPAPSLHAGRRCRRLTASGDVAALSFESGSDVSADVVIGADGLHSVVRAHVQPRVSLRYSGQSAYRGVARTTLDQPDVRTAREVWGPGFRFGYGAVAPDEVYWFATIDAPAGERSDAGRMREGLMRRTVGYAAPVPALVEATDESNIIRTDLYDFVPFRGWHRGNVVLVGDAAHATTPNLGQGGAQAIEDAWVLAAELGRGDGVAAAFARYEEIRWAKARTVVERSRLFGHLVHLKNPFARAARNVLVRRTPASATLKQMRSLFTLNF